jgi:hypothetical protein
MNISIFWTKLDEDVWELLTLRGLRLGRVALLDDGLYHASAYDDNEWESFICG